MRRSLMVFVAALLSASCGVHAPWHGSSAYTSAERVEIQIAHDFVCGVTNGTCEPIAWDLDPAERSFGIIRERPPIPGAIAMGGGLLYLPPLPNLRRVAGHEFGHWRGLMHIPAGERGLMVEVDDGETELVWTEADERECVRVRCRED